MFKHLFLTAQRHLRKDWPYTLINIIGLTIGLSLVFFIILYVNREYSWNKTHEHRDQVYRVLITTEQFDWTEPTSSYPLGQAMKEDLPDIHSFSRQAKARVSAIVPEQDNMPIVITGADPGVFNIFSFDIIKGAGVSQLIKTKDDIVLSLQTANMLFGNEDPIGKTVNFTGRHGDMTLTVSSIFDDFPSTSTFKPRALVNIDWMLSAYSYVPNLETNFRTGIMETYFRLNDGVSEADFQKQLKGIEEKYFAADWKMTLSMQNLSDIYLHSSDLVNARTTMGDPKKIRIFSLVGILVLLIATFNYIILASARAAFRFREIGLRKITGASRSSISSQVYGESILTTLLAFPLSLLVVALLIPKINQILGTNIAFDLGVHPWLLPGFLLMCLVVGVVSGAYLAVYLSRLRPVDILRTRSGLGNTRSGLYKVLVTLQVLIFISMLSCSSIIFKQVRFAEKMDQGFDRENLYMIDIDMYKFTRWNAFAEELRNLSGVDNAGVAMGGPPTESKGVYMVSHKTDPNQSITVEGLSVGANYPETMGFRLASGRLFSPGVEADTSRPVIVNEAAIRELGVEGDPIDQVVGNSRIIGVIEDFHVHSVKSIISPLFISYGTNYCYEVAVRIRPDQQEETIKQIEAVYKSMAGPDVLFSIQSFDEALASTYTTERNFAQTLTGFTGLAIIIAILGLFGLSLLMAARRTREIGIRKVYGAPVWRVILTINRSFTIYTMFAFLLSIPLTIWIMQKWLQNFVYRVNFGWVEFVGAGIIALVIVWLTVTYSAWRTARMNPAAAIRVE